jgi:hypothetical protein
MIAFAWIAVAFADLAVFRAPTSEKRLVFVCTALRRFALLFEFVLPMSLKSVKIRY